MGTVDEHALNAMVETMWPASNARCEAVSSTSARARRAVVDDDLRPGGFVSGPTVFGVVDCALWFLASGALGRVEPMALTQELSIRYLRPAVGDVVYAEATLERIGRRTVVGTVRAWTTDRDRPCATAQGTYVLPERPRDAD